MLDQDGNLTDIGAWYLGFGATGNVPKATASAGSRTTVAGSALLAVFAAFWFML